MVAVKNVTFPTSKAEQMLLLLEKPTTTTLELPSIPWPSIGEIDDSLGNQLHIELVSRIPLGNSSFRFEGNDIDFDAYSITSKVRGSREAFKTIFKLASNKTKNADITNEMKQAGLHLDFNVNILNP